MPNWEGGRRQRLASVHVGRCRVLAFGNLSTADARANFFAVGKVWFVCNSKLRWRFTNPLTFPSLHLNSSSGWIDGERGEEAVAVGAGVLNPAELGVDLLRIALVAI